MARRVTSAPPASEISTPNTTPLDDLRPEHLLALEVQSRDIIIAALQKQIKDAEIKIKMQEQRLLAYELEDLRRQQTQAVETLEGKRKLRTTLIASVKGLYGISDTLSYHPETGKIVRG